MWAFFCHFNLPTVIFSINRIFNFFVAELLQGYNQTHSKQGNQL